MIARFRVLLPLTIAVPSRDSCEAHIVKVRDYEVRIYPPYRAKSSIAPLSPPPLSSEQMKEALEPDTAPPLYPRVTVNELSATLANALQIDFIKDSFDRTKPDAEPQFQTRDPPLPLIYATANRFLSRLRSVLQSEHIEPISSANVSYIRYLNDDETELDPEEGKIRAFSLIRGKFEVSILTPTHWQHYLACPADYEAPIWESMQLDALALLPQVGPALVMAAAALETLIVQSLNELIKPTAIPTELWSFLNARDQYWKEPSINDRFTKLLRALSGRSLNDEPKLWKAFKDIRYARNAFVHEGRVLVHRKPKDIEVTPEMAHDLIVSAGEIITWTERLLPVRMRRLRIEVPANIQSVFPIFQPKGPQAAP